MSAAQLNIKNIFILTFLFLYKTVASAQTPMPDTARIGAYLGQMYKANKDSIEVPSYRKTGIRRSKEALDTATIYRLWMPVRFFDAWEIRALYMINYEKKGAQAESMFDSLILWREKYQKNEIQHAMALYQKSRVYFARRDYGKSDSLILLTLNMFRLKGDTQSIRYAKIINSYGQLLINMKRPDEGEKTCLAALALIEKSGERRQYAGMLNDWSESKSQQRKFDAGEKGFIQVRAILDSISRANPPYKYEPMYFGAGINLAKLYLNRNEKGDDKKGEALFYEIIQFNQDTLGTSYLAAITGMAGLNFQRKNYAEARKYYERSIRLKSKVYAKNHPALRQEEFRLLKLNYADKNIPQAESALNRLLPQYTMEFLKASDYFSEREFLSYQKGFNDEFFVTCSFAKDHPSSTMSKLLYNLVLTTKTSILDNNLALRSAIQRNGEDAAAQWDNWKELKKKVEEAVSQNEPTDELEKEISLLEKKMTFYKEKSEARKVVTWEDVRNALAPGQVAVEFLAFRYRNPVLTDSVFYVALVIRPESQFPEFIELFEQRQLTSLLQVAVCNDPGTYTLLYRGSSRDNTLDNLIWTNKLAKYIRPNETVLFSSDGDLARINILAISIGLTGKSLWSYCNWSEVSSTRELAVQQKAAAQTPTYPQANDYVLIYGGIDYGIQIDSLKKQRADSGWSFLKGTQEEAVALDNTCKTLKIASTLLLGPSATETTLINSGNGEKTNSPWLLHFGTHGFYYELDKAKKPSPSTLKPFFATKEDPMWRTGIKLANSYPNWYRKQDAQETSTAEDGILFAYEAAQLDLSQTFLTVLSACETGGGESQGFEGIFGLRRGFRVAGSRYQLLALWETDDTASVYFMQQFYSYLLEKREEIHKSFAMAQKDLRRKYPEPYYWACFILLGPPK